MITTGIIRQINRSSDSNHLSNLYSVEIAIFATPASNTDSSRFTLECACSTVPGIYNSYEEGDTVFVGFVNNNFNKPIILGKIYEGVNNFEARSYLDASTLSVSEKIVLDKNVSINDISVQDLETLIQDTKELVDIAQTGIKFMHSIKLTGNSYDVRLNIVTSSSKKISSLAILFDTVASTNVAMLDNLIPSYDASGYYNSLNVIYSIFKIRMEKTNSGAVSIKCFSADDSGEVSVFDIENSTLSYVNEIHEIIS